MFKKILSLLLTAAIAAACIIPVSALGGTWNGVRWDIANGVLTVSGGDIPDLDASSSAPWNKFGGTVTAIIIGEGVSVIGERAFEDMTAAVTLDLGGTAAIGRMAFSGCTSLSEITLPDSVRSVGDFAFAECSALQKAILSQNLNSLGEGVFESCPTLGDFAGSSSRYTVSNGVITDTVTSSVYRYAPAKAETDYTAPDSITAIAGGAFRDCANLQSITVPKVTSIGDGAFYGCTSLIEVAIPSAVTVGRAAFYGCGMAEIKLPASLTTLGGEAFAFCKDLVIADFAGNAPAAESGIFYGCDPAFTVVIAGSSTGFGDSEWLGYPLLRHGGAGGEIDGIRWGFDTLTGEFTMEAQSGTVLRDFEYAADAPWYKYRKLIRSLTVTGVTVIGANAFRYSAIESLDLPESVTGIGEWAFSGCTSLRTVRTTADIDDRAFFSCVNLERVQLDSSTVGTQAFSGCDALKYVFTGMTAPVIGEYTFDGTDAVILYPYGGTGYGNEGVYSEAYTAGDANGDGVCNIADVSHLLKYIAKWDVTVQKISADCNTDGKLNASDVTAMLKHIAKWDLLIFGITSTEW